MLSSYLVLELGAGCALPSLLLSTLPEPPSLIVVTDYPDEGIMGNLKINVEKNHDIVTKACTVQSYGYEWGTDPSNLLYVLFKFLCQFLCYISCSVPFPLRNLLDINEKQVLGYDIMILSDLLHFSASHDALISSVQMLLAKLESARIYVGVSFTRVLNSTPCKPIFLGRFLHTA